MSILHGDFPLQRRLIYFD